jgi:hypothetical protein
MPASYVPALQDLTNPMLTLASLTNPMALGLASAIGPDVLASTPIIAPAPASYLAPAVAADVAPAASDGVILAAVVATGKEKEKNGQRQ